MANRRCEPGFYGTTTETAEYNTVFVDTSFDTHLAMLVCKSDTVSDLKKKIVSEHMHFFPKIEDIHIHSLKVKRKTSFYHLADNMLVWSALQRAKGNWFLSVDASSSSSCHLNQNPSELDLTKCTTMDVRNVDSSCRGLSSDTNRTQETIPISLEKTTDIQNSNLSGKKKTHSKKKRKRSRTEVGQDVRADQSGAVPFKAPDISDGLMDAQETIQDTETSTGQKKRKKKKSKKSANNVVYEKREPAKENQHSSGNGHVGVPIVEKAKDSETTDSTNKNAKEEINMKMLTTSDVQEDLPVTDQNNDIGIHEASTQVLACQSEEKLEEKHEIAVKTDHTDHLARATEEINFKDYFLHCEVKNADQSSMEMKSKKKVNTNGGLPSASISTDVQSSSKLSADHKSKNKSHVRKDSSERGSACNSDSSRRSSRVLENVVKDSSTSERLETNLPKPKEIIAESSILEKKNASVVKSSLKKFPGESGNRMELKTPKKKIVLKKPGTLFEDVCGDENGTAHSSGSTRSPSHSSSMSNHTKSESDLSQDSIRDGSGGAKGQSTPGKGRSKLDILLDSGEEITIQKILRSSKRYKKAKLIALQNEANEAVHNESQPIEFIPDSLP